MNAPNNVPMMMPGGGGGMMTTVDPAAIAAAEQARVRIQMAYFMATQKPRNPMEARSKILQACKRPKFAEDAIYHKPMGRDEVSGPSIRLAEEAIRAWGNILVLHHIVTEDEDMRRIQVSCTDLESGASYSKEVVVTKRVERRSKAGREVLGERLNSRGKTVYIVRATDEEMRAKEASEISKAIRNEGLRLIPSDIVEEAIETAIQTAARRDSEDPQGRLKAICDAFMTIGVGPAEIERYLGHKLDTVSPAELIDLRGIYRAIRDGETTWNNVMENKPTDEVMEETERQINALKGRLGAGDFPVETEGEIPNNEPSGVEE